MGFGLTPLFRDRRGFMPPQLKTKTKQNPYFSSIIHHSLFDLAEPWNHCLAFIQCTSSSVRWIIKFLSRRYKIIARFYLQNECTQEFLVFLRQRTWNSHLSLSGSIFSIESQIEQLLWMTFFLIFRFSHFIYIFILVSSFLRLCAMSIHKVENLLWSILIFVSKSGI